MLITATLENAEAKAYNGILVTDSPVNECLEDNPAREAFYAICSAIAVSQSIDKAYIKPESKLEIFFPRQNRRQKIRAFQQALGIDIQLVALRAPLEWGILLCALVSFIALFVSWQAGLISFAFTGLVSWLSVRFGWKLAFETVKQLSERVADEHYKQR
jgi:hypothetical protein